MTTIKERILRLLTLPYRKYYLDFLTDDEITLRGGDFRNKRARRHAQEQILTGQSNLLKS